MIRPLVAALMIAGLASAQQAAPQDEPIALADAAAQTADSADQSSSSDSGTDTKATSLQPRHLRPENRYSVKGFVREDLRFWSSPFRRSSYDSHTVKKYVIPFALLSGVLIGTDHLTENALPNTPDQAMWSGRVSQFGAAYTLAGVSGGLFLLGKIKGDDHATETGWLGLQAIAHTQIIAFGLKVATNRERPLDYTRRVGFWGGGNSFPSGHAATSFALASVVSYEYRDHPAVPITAYSIASLVSLSRISARRHFLSDIFVGGSMGFLIGRSVYKNNHDPSLPGSPVERSRSSRLVPEFGFTDKGPALMWNLGKRR